MDEEVDEDEEEEDPVEYLRVTAVILEDPLGQTEALQGQAAGRHR